MAEIKYHIVEKIAVLSEKGSWTKEINKVSWNGRDPKFDIRDWNHEEGKMRKGITLTDDEVRALLEALQEVL